MTSVGLHSKSEEKMKEKRKELSRKDEEIANNCSVIFKIFKMKVTWLEK